MERLSRVHLEFFSSWIDTCCRTCNWRTCYISPSSECPKNVSQIVLYKEMSKYCLLPWIMGYEEIMLWKTSSPAAEILLYSWTWFTFVCFTDWLSNIYMTLMKSFEKQIEGNAVKWSLRGRAVYYSHQKIKVVGENCHPRDSLLVKAGYLPLDLCL